MRCAVIYPAEHAEMDLPEIVLAESLPRAGDPWVHHFADGTTISFLVIGVAFHVMASHDVPVPAAEVVINLRP